MKIKWHYFGCKRCVRSSNFSLRFVKSLQASSQLALVRSIIGMKCCFLIHQNRILCHIKNQKGATRTSQGFSYLKLLFLPMIWNLWSAENEPPKARQKSFSWSFLRMHRYSTVNLKKDARTASCIYLKSLLWSRNIDTMKSFWQ